MNRNHLQKSVVVDTLATRPDRPEKAVPQGVFARPLPSWSRAWRENRMLRNKLFYCSVLVRKQFRFSQIGSVQSWVAGLAAQNKALTAC
ncbi:MAG: hypothetical protein ABIK45_07220 [Pseudomonadota bacterium]